MTLSWIKNLMKRKFHPSPRPRTKARFAPRIEALEERSLMAAGALDPTFGPVAHPGYATLDLDNNFDVASAMAIQPDGKIVVAGFMTVVGDRQLAVARYLPNGQLDDTFGLNGTGLVTTDVSLSDEAHDVAIQADGKIVVVGRSAVQGGHTDFLVARYTSSGQLDTGVNGFSGDGIQIIPNPGGFSSEANTLAIQPDGKIVVAGFVQAGDRDVQVIRLQANGDIDLPFGAANTGFVIYDSGAGIYDQANDVLLQGDKILVAGTKGTSQDNQDILLLRYTADGDSDNGFGVGGVVTTDFSQLLSPSDEGVGAAALTPDGQIVVAGGREVSGILGTTQGWMLVQYDGVTGQIDGNFGNGGLVSTEFGSNVPGAPSARGMVVQPDGKIVAAGSNGLGGTFGEIGVARYNPDGSLDNTFGTGGKVTLAINGTTLSSASDVALQADGKIVVAGLANSNGLDFALARFRGDTPPTNPPVTGDVTTQVSVIQGKVRRTRVAGRFRQKVTLVNTGNSAITGPLYLVLDGLRRRVKLRKPDGFTQKQAPLGKRYRIVSPGGDNVLSPGESVSVTLQFNNPLLKRIRYSPRVLANVGQP